MVDDVVQLLDVLHTHCVDVQTNIDTLESGKAYKVQREQLNALSST